MDISEYKLRQKLVELVDEMEQESVLAQATIDVQLDYSEEINYSEDPEDKPSFRLMNPNTLIKRRNAAKRAKQARKRNRKK